MAVVSLNTNVSSLQTQRRLAQSTSALSKNFERLSSGLRVSKAADDAAGLAIASGLNADSRVFSQGLRNLSDGVSVTNIAEGALNELTNIVMRLEELAEQAANGTLGVKQRVALDAEAQALSKEYFRIARTTKFNGQNLFDGSMQGLILQAGYGAAGSLRSSLAGKLGTGGFSAPADCGVSDGAIGVELGDLNGDGLADIVSASSGSNSASIFLGNGDGTFRTKADYFTGTYPGSITLGDLNDDGVLDIAGSNSTSAFVLVGNGDGTFRTKSDYVVGTGANSVALGDVNGDGAADLVAANSTAGTVSVLIGNGDGTLRAKQDFDAGTSPSSIVLDDLNHDGFLDIATADSGTTSASILLGNGDGTFKLGVDYTTAAENYDIAVGDLNGDGAADFVTTNYNLNNATVCLGNGDGSFKTGTDYVTATGPYGVLLGDVNGDGVLDLLTGNYGSNNISVLIGNGDGSFQSKTDFQSGVNTAWLARGDLNGDGVLDIVAANYGGDNVTALLGQTRDGVSPLLEFSLKSKADALQALSMFKQSSRNLSTQRGIIGATQSRLTTAVANLEVERENYFAAGSQITDVDAASESSQLLKTQILQQAASAVLAQANESPALALLLLRV